MASYSELRGGAVYDSNNDKVGTLDNFYVDDDTNQPTWITVRTGLFGSKINFVPLAGAKEAEGGLRVAFTKDQIGEAPKAEPDQELEESEEGELYSYYRALIEQGETDVAVQADRGGDRNGQEAADESAETAGRAAQGAGASGTDNAMTRSEEELQVSKQPVETGRVKLKKYVTTENVNFTVPVQRERVRLVQEPITDANAAAAESGQELSEDEHEVVLHEEQVAVDKNVVPKERLRLEKDAEQGEHQVDESVRKEQVDVEGDEDKK